MSSILVHPGKYVQRCSVTSSSGEECVLTFTLMAESGAAATEAPSTSSSSSSSSSSSQQRLKGHAANLPSAIARHYLVPRDWRLVRVVGEPLRTDLPESPSPEFPPEMIVQAHLAAFR